MYKLLFFLLAGIIAGTGYCSAQATTRLSVSLLPSYNGEPLVLESRNYPVAGDSLRITTFRFYISGVVLADGERQVWAEENSYHLVDMADMATAAFVLKLPAALKYNRIQYLLGIDSATNAAGAKDGDLDATKGMYWAWQSGYINLKMEGTSPLCKTRKNVFQYHLGGFRDGNYCSQIVSLPIAANAAAVNIEVDAAKLLDSADLVKQPELMTPGAAARLLSVKAAEMFQITEK